MQDQAQGSLTIGESIKLRMTPTRPTMLTVHVEYLNGERAWIPIDELDLVRRAFRFVPPSDQA